MGTAGAKVLLQERGWLPESRCADGQWEKEVATVWAGCSGTRVPPECGDTEGWKQERDLH